MRIGLVPYQRGWSYDLTAQALAQHLPDEVHIFHDDTIDEIDHRNLDVLVDFWWRGGLAKRFGKRVLVQVSSHRWTHEKYNGLDASELANQYLRRAGGVLVPSVRLLGELSPLLQNVAICPKGFHPETFGDFDQRRGDLVVGWAGNANARDKRLDVLHAAWRDLRLATDLPYSRMPDFYNSIDVITCASDAEGDPRPLIEGMACGCFPVVVDVGIVPELVRHGENGLIVERTPKAFAEAFAWCRENPEIVREVGRRNALEMLATRTWARCAQSWRTAFVDCVLRAPEWKTNERMERVYRVKAAIRKRRAMRAMQE